MPRAFVAQPPFFIDAYERGAFRTQGELMLYLRARGFDATPTDLSPTPVREVLARCCRNLVAHYAAGGHHHRARMFEAFLGEFDATYERHTA